jgi:nucleotide-binding universal stress UspA family protein
MSLPNQFLVAVDLGAHSERVLDTAFALAERLAAQVHLVHAFTLSELPESMLRSEGLAGAQGLLERRLLDVAEPRRGSGRLGEVQVREGDPASVIVKAARQLAADLIFVDSYHSGFNRALHGSVAEAVIREAPCAVYVLHQDGSAL